MRLYVIVIFLYIGSFYLFFFKQKTAYEMRISDWSSDVCSSDLELVRDRPARRAADKAQFAPRGHVVDLVDDAVDVERQRIALRADLPVKIGRASCRERVCQ